MPAGCQVPAMRRAFTVLLLASVLVSISAPVVYAAGARLLVVEATAGPDGWAVVAARLPPGSYRVVKVEHRLGPGWHGAAARPLLYATLPDPKLWSALSKLPVVAPSEQPRPMVRIVDGVLQAAVPAEPGTRVKIVIERTSTQHRVNPLMVIVVPPDNPVAKQYAEEIAGLHEKQGMRVMVVTTREVVEKYPEAPAPRGICEPGKDGTPRYNLTVALHIIGMERALLHEGLRYLLLIGGAREVPPVYYCSPLLRELVSPREGIVPSDYYYADPNYDGVAEVAVGRIPFSDALGLASYLEALKAWTRGGSWQHLALVTGGAPFASTLFIGEAAASEAAATLRAAGLSVDELLLSRGDYEGLRLSGYIGRYGVYYIMAHGSGSSLLDYIPGGLWNYDFQELLYSSDITYAAHPGIYLLPACRDGYWDTDLVKPPFKPPSIGVALLRHGAAVAYVGFSRVAVEVIDAVDAAAGRLTVGMAGADRLLLEMLKEIMSSSTIGDAWARALTAYNALPSSHYRAYLAQGEEEIGTLVTRTAVLLGDPAAVLPWRSSSLPPAPPGMRVPGGIEVGAALAAPTLARYASGSLYAVNPGPDGRLVVEFTGGCPSELHAWALEKVMGTTLIGMVKLNTSMYAANGTCRVVIDDNAAPSTVRLLAIFNQTPHAYYLIAAGAYVKGDKLVLRGLDALLMVGDEPLLLEAGNVTVTTLQGGAPYAVIPLSRLPLNTTIRVAPLYATASIYGGPVVASQVAKLYKLFTVHVEQAAAMEHVPVFAVREKPLHGEAAEGTATVSTGSGGSVGAPAPLMWSASLALLAAAAVSVAAVERSVRHGS